VRGRGRWRRLLLGLAVAAGLLGAVRVWPRPPLLAAFPASVAVQARGGELLRLTLAADGRYRLPVRLDAVSPQLVEAILWHEDRFFFLHPGVNPWALLRGALRTYGVGDRRVGGSTLTMQLARRLYGIESRRLSGKLLQVLRALELEAKYGKREILEAWLNLAPYGGNVEGVGAASLIYFRRPAATVTLAEALTLAVVPQSPARRAPRPGNAALEAARIQLAADWDRTRGAGAAGETATALPLRIQAAADLPFLAPHAVQGLLAAQASVGSAAPATAVIRSTLDLPLQRRLETLLRAHVERERRVGIDNAAALLVDLRDMSVVASVGSASFFDAAIQGQNDGTRARRSPGSTLKPFIYALAIDQGLVHPRSMLRDTPRAFGAQSPENFDGEFAGPLSVQDALLRSRNVPAVAVGLRLARPGFHAFLRSAGVARLEPESHYGLALYLGGPELTMRELATLYAALAHGGVLRPLRDRLDTPASAPAPGPGVRLFSEGASFMTLDMLGQQQRPSDAFLGGAVRGQGPLYWKTGTSTAFRDAWTAGVFDHYVLVVWLGSFDGRPNPALVGVQVAAPLWLQVVDALRATRGRGQTAATDRPDLMLRPPDAVRRVEVCADSGDLPNEWCPRRASTWYLPGVSPIRVSTLHRAVWVDPRTGRQACPGVDPATLRREVHEFWPSDLLELYARAGLPRRPPPPLDPSCALAQADADAGVAPEILSPVTGVSYLMRPGGERNRIELRAVSDAGVRALYWFVDDAFIGSSRSDATLEWEPRSPGRHFVRAVDEAGRATGRAVQVEWAE
jgi:penicillin-binding protein 1C